MQVPPLVLVGPPGVPVVAVADAVGRALGRPVRATDAEVERLTGRPVAEVLVEDGEAALREAEREAVRAALGTPGAVVALGSGAVLDEEVRAALRTDGAALVVHLDLDASTSARRAGLNAPGAVALGATRARWRALHTERTALLARVADLRADASDEDPDVVAEAVVGALATWSPAPAAVGADEDVRP